MKAPKLILLFLLVSVTRASYAILPDTVYIRKPESLGLMYQELDVTTQDNYHIATWFFPAQKRLSDSELEQLNGAKRICQTPKNETFPTIIICNGDAGNMSYLQLHLAETWTNMGFNVVTFDWRGFGASSPFTMDNNYLCYTEMLEDYEAVINTVAARPEVEKGAIAVMGWSTGAYLSMITAFNNGHVSAFIGRSLPTSFEEFIPLVMKVRNKTREQLLIPEDFPVDSMPVFIASGFTKPVFLINGEKDIRTPVWMSRKILELLPESTPRELMIVKDAAHGGNQDPILIDFEHFTTRTAKFLKENLPRPICPDKK